MAPPLALRAAVAGLLLVEQRATATADNSTNANTALPAECCACEAAGNYTCDDVALSLGLYEGQFAGESIRFLSYTTAARLPVVATAAAALLACTGAVVNYEDAVGDLRPEVEGDLGYGRGGDGPGIYDAYAMKSSWAAALADEGLLEGLGPRVAATPGLRWNDILPSARALGAVQSEGESSTVMLPMDGDYWTLLVRDDLLEAHGATAPDTVEELVELAERFHGADLNADGTPDFGVCAKLLGPQPWVASLFYFVVAPYLQADGPRIFFDATTLEPLVDNPGWRKAALLLRRMAAAGRFSKSKDLVADFNAGRCAFFLALPGTTKKAQLKGVRRTDSNGTVLWEGSARRVLVPGSREVLGPTGATLEECDGTGKVCPYESATASGQYVNRAPFFVTGGWGVSLRAGAPEGRKRVAWAYLAYMSRTADVVAGGVMDAYRSSQFAAGDYLAAGWTQEQFDEFLVVHASAMGRDAPANVGLDLMVPGYSAYLFDVLETQLTTFLNASDASAALNVLVNATYHGWMQTHEEQGGIDKQLRIYRRSLSLQDLYTCPEGEFYSESSATCMSSTSFDGTTLIIVVSVLGGLLVLAGLGLFFWWVRNTYRRKQELEAAAAALIEQQVEESMEIIDQLHAPLVLMRGSDFKRLGRLRVHEETRDDGLLLFVDTKDKFRRMIEQRYLTIFFSHQWVAFEAPDPEGEQYAVMVAALDKIASQEKREVEDIYVWVDIFSIPQECRTVQKLAIVSLPAIASILTFFVTICPEVEHKNTGEICDKASYHRRCWCRAEVMSHCARRGTRSMFYAVGTGRDIQIKEMAPEGATAAFLEDMSVFQGDLTCCRLGHDGGAACCDREELMLPMLGLYAEIYEQRHAPEVRPIFEAIETRIDTVYPAEFDYYDGVGTTSKTLFGDLIMVLRHKIDAQTATKSQVRPIDYGKLRAGSTKNQESKHGVRHGAQHGSLHASRRRKTVSVPSPNSAPAPSVVRRQSA